MHAGAYYGLYEYGNAYAIMSLLRYEIATCYLFTGAEPLLMQILGDTSFQELTSMWCQNSNHRDNLHLLTNRV